MTATRRSLPFLAFLGFAASLVLGMFGHARLAQTASAGDLLAKRRLVEALGLTDLCLFTDARYTRHLALADLHTPFQDSPMSFEHFPSGSLVAPPPHLTGSRLGPQTPPHP